MDKKTRLAINSIARGRNGYAPPWAIKDDECVDAVNVDFYRAPLGRKRGGTLAVATAFFAGGPFTGIISSLFRHVPGTDESAAELWAIDDAATNVVGRLIGPSVGFWLAPTLKDAPTGNGWDWTAASINGHLMLSYKSAQNRLHVWDGSTVRRTGLHKMDPPTVADTGGGAYAAVGRFYRTRAVVQVAGVTVRRSEYGPHAAFFTPSGAGTAARVTFVTAPGEGETHWEVEVSLDTITFYRLATVAIGTATYDDSAATTSYKDNPLSAATGAYTEQKSYKFIAADQNRVLGFGSWTSTDKQARIEISAVIGSSDIGDEERVDTSTTNAYIDLDESDSGVATGLCGPVLGSFFAFKERQVWQLTPTGTLAQPYRQEAIHKSIGAIAHYAIARGEDKDGNAALYWMSHRGPYRWSLTGLEYIGQGVEDAVLGPTNTINLSATHVVARVVYFPDKRQVWYWWAVDSGNDPTFGAIYDIVTEGWSRVPVTNLWAKTRCATMFGSVSGAVMTRDLKPYLGPTTAANLLLKADTGLDDNGAAYQSYIITKALEPGGPGRSGTVGDVSVMAKAASGVTLAVTAISDFGIGTKPSSVLLTPTAAAETRVITRAGDTGFGNVQFVQYQIGDSAAVANTWSLERLVVPEVTQAASSQ